MAQEVAFPGGPIIGPLPPAGGELFDPLSLLSSASGLPGLSGSSSATSFARSGDISGDFSVASGEGARAGAADSLGPLTGDNLSTVVIIGAVAFVLIAALRRG